MSERAARGALSGIGRQTGLSASEHIRRPRIYAVPPGRPFLDVLARAILDGKLGSFGDRQPSALALTDITLLLPTRRATRALQDAFLRNMPQGAVLLPKIRAISDTDDELSQLTGLAGITTLPGIVGETRPHLRDGAPHRADAPRPAVVRGDARHRGHWRGG